MTKVSTKSVGRPSSPTSENFIELYTEGVEVPNQSSISMNNLKEGVTVLTPRDIILRCKKGKIKGYPNNRGRGKIVPSTVNEIAENFIPHAIGMVTLVEDGTIVDSHNRIGGLCRRAQIGKMTGSDWETQIPVRVVTCQQFMETYKGLGGQHPHSIADHLGNPDLLLGSCIVGENGIASYLSKIGMKEHEQYLLKASSALTVIANIMTALHLKNSNNTPESIGEFKTYSDVYKVRHFMKKMAQDLKGDPIALIHPNDYRKVAEGCVYYEQFRKSLRTQKERDEFLPPIKGLTGNNGLMGLIIADIVFNDKSDRQLTKISPNTLAQRLLHRAERVEEVLADILGSNNKNADTAIKKVIKIAEQPIEIQ